MFKYLLRVYTPLSQLPPYFLVNQVVGYMELLLEIKMCREKNCNKLIDLKTRTINTINWLIEELGVTSHGGYCYTNGMPEELNKAFKLVRELKNIKVK